MSVANLIHRDGTEVLELGVRIPMRIQIERFEPGEAIVALDRLRRNSLTGSAILEITG